MLRYWLMRKPGRFRHRRHIKMHTKSDSRRQDILNTVEDMMSDFLYYDRKEDETLPVGAIEEAVAQNEISVDEIAAFFAKHLTEALKP